MERIINLNFKQKKFTEYLCRFLHGLVITSKFHFLRLTENLELSNPSQPGQLFDRPEKFFPDFCFLREGVGAGAVVGGKSRVGPGTHFIYSGHGLGGRLLIYHPPGAAFFAPLSFSF